MITLLGIAALAVAAIIIGRYALAPAEDAAERRQGVLTGLMKPRVVECRILEDADLPEGIPAPPVGRDILYLRVSVLYPGATREPDKGLYKLVKINGLKHRMLGAVFVEREEADEGFYVDAIFRTDSGFEYAELMRGDTIVVEKVGLDFE